MYWFHNKRRPSPYLLVTVLLGLTWMMGQLPAFSSTDHEPPTPTLFPTVEALKPVEVPPTTPTVVLIPTATSIPTALPTVEPTITVAPTNSPLPTQTIVPPIVLPTEVPISRKCPEIAPRRPVYDRGIVGEEAWKMPALSDPINHFWLAKPLPGEGRFLTSFVLPYGFDGGGIYLLHNGVDTAVEFGTPVLAVASGRVVVAQSDANALYGWRCDWYGKLVVIELKQRWLDQPIYVLYGHLSEWTVEVGETVKQGEMVGRVGSSGVAIAPHLHLEVRIGENRFNATQNPLLWISPGATRGVIAGRIVDPTGRAWQGVNVEIAGISSGTSYRTTNTYLGDDQHLINPDDLLAENFVVGDLRPGRYEVRVTLQGTHYTVPVTVEAGKVAAISIETAPYKTPTPMPEASN